MSTVKAPAADILAWAAYHLEAGAHRLFIYLDAPCPDARDLLGNHPKIRVFDCDDASWAKRRKGGKPAQHQVRQTLNATRAYRRQTKGLDWLAHIDVDEFLWSELPLGSLLSGLGSSTLCARARPIEALAGDGTAFKAYLPPDRRARVAARLYPRFGSQVKGGFLSHVQGKLFVRTGLDGVSFRIHNIYRDDEENPGQEELPQVDLCHFHARDWDSWLAHYRYRLASGSYRPELGPAFPRAAGGQNMHELLSALESEGGEAALRSFFDEMCADSPGLRARLDSEGCLRIRELGLETARRKHFPAFG